MMSFNELLPVILGVLKDLRTIIAVVAAIFVLSLVNWVVRYQKKPVQLKKSRAPVKQEAKKEEPSKPAESNGEE